MGSLPYKLRAVEGRIEATNPLSEAGDGSSGLLWKAV